MGGFLDTRIAQSMYTWAAVISSVIPEVTQVKAQVSMRIKLWSFEKVEMRIGGSDQVEVPPEVEIARAIDWGVPIDAYLTNAARVGARFAASVYLDRSGVSANGMTVITPPVREVARIQGLEMLQSISGTDHYVIVTRMSD